ncbi:MAG: Flavin reductase like domain protein [Methanomassiliicoccales archaeon PtaU1.Bin124]|nr:MAG: Flavin reductase like domain protein [Methanomassiliicoccales archaeon PtaU1.Bin124]
MAQKKMGKKLPPMALPVCLIGANVKGRANFCTIAWFTVIDDDPATFGVVMAKKRCTKDGIEENGTFSLSLPGNGMAAAADYCGIKSGYDVDKSEVFDLFYGSLGSAPLIKGCPVTVECKLVNIIEFAGVDMVVGEVAETYVDDSIMEKGKASLERFDPLLYGMGGGPYYHLGEKGEKAFAVGKKFKK